MKERLSIVAAMLACALSLTSAPTVAQEQTQAMLFAKVGDQSISRAEYESELTRAMQQRFYHGRPPEGQVEQLRSEVADELILRTLLLQEASRRGLHAEQEAIDQTIDTYDRRYANSPTWQSQREAMLSKLRLRLEEESLLRQLQEQVRHTADPNDAQLRAYYRDYPDRFTEPAKQKISVVMLAVDPSSPSSVWDATMARGDELAQQLRAGADFASIAREHSNDRSSAQGGDMGYLHAGMLSPAAQTAVDELPIGAISDPLRLLEGIAIFRVDARTQATLRNFEDVADRAKALWIREQSEAQWLAFQEDLRANTAISIFAENAPAATE